MTNKNVKDPSVKFEEAKKIAEKQSKSSAFDGVEESLLRFFRWISYLVDKLFFAKRNTALFALVIAVITFAAFNINESTFASNIASSRTLSNVNVTARYNSESFEVSGLPTSCDVVLTGDAANVNNAATRSGYCLLNLEGYTEGTHTVKLTTSGFGDGVQTIVVPSETQVVLKRKTTAQFDLDYDFINKNSLDARYILSEPTFGEGQSVVNIRASQDTLNSIAFVKALIDVSGQSGNFTVEAPLVAYNTKGQLVNVEIVPSSVTATVAIETHSKEVPINIELKGAPPLGLSIESISLDHQTTNIYGTAASINNVDSVYINFDLSTISTDANIMQPVVLPQGVSASDVTMVNVQVTLGQTDSKEFLEIPIAYRNRENNVVADSSLETYSVKVIAKGTTANLESIVATDIVAYIDLVDEEGNPLEAGKYNITIKAENKSTPYISYECEPNSIDITLVNQD